MLNLFLFTLAEREGKTRFIEGWHALYYTETEHRSVVGNS